MIKPLEEFILDGLRDHAINVTLGPIVGKEISDQELRRIYRGSITECNLVFAWAGLMLGKEIEESLEALKTSVRKALGR